jgi:hypothetical protein
MIAWYWVPAAVLMTLSLVLVFTETFCDDETWCDFCGRCHR